MRKYIFLAMFLGCFFTLTAYATTTAESHPVITDPESVDQAYPPAMREFSFLSHGSKLNALIYQADGAGPHPTTLLLHGYPGNERNLDLAQALRRAGSNVVYFNYRGSWGSGGTFSVNNALEDVGVALALLRDKKWAVEYRVNPEKIALIGHSFGGFLGAMTAAEDQNLACFGFIAGVNLGQLAVAINTDEKTRANFELSMGKSMNADGGPIHANPKQFVAEIGSNAERYNLINLVNKLSRQPIIMIAGERDLSLPRSDHHDPIVNALKAANTQQLTEVILDDGHAFSAHRIELAQRLVEWQDEDCW